MSTKEISDTEVIMEKRNKNFRPHSNVDQSLAHHNTFATRIAMVLLPGIGMLALGIWIGATWHTENSAYKNDAELSSASIPPNKIQALSVTERQDSQPIILQSVHPFPAGNSTAIESGIRAAMNFAPKGTIDYLVREFYPNKPSDIDSATYLKGLLNIVKEYPIGSAANLFMRNSVYFTNKPPEDIVRNGRIPYTPMEGSRELPFSTSPGGSTNLQIKELDGINTSLSTNLGSVIEQCCDTGVAIFDASVKRIYAAFNTTNDTYILAKWLNPSGELIDFRTYPLNHEMGVNYVWVERSNWQLGKYTVEFYLPSSLKLAAFGNFKIQ